MKDSISFKITSIHPFNVSSTDLFLSKDAIFEFLPVKFSRAQKELLQTLFLITQSQFALKTSVHFISLVFS